MFRTSTLAYWCCQAAGWGLAWGVLTLNQFYFNAKPEINLIICASGFLATHLLRTFIRRYLPPTPSFRKEGVRMILAMIFTTGLFTAFRYLGSYYLLHHHLDITSQVATYFDDFLFILPWTLIYSGYRLVVRTRAQALERRRLEWRLREMQAHAGESEVTMEDLMEEVNRIVALIDENPESARSEITAFSRLLREGHLV
ncbi:MAG TPA: hypothetical protein VGS79_08960 [Puia sp.]|nr:hypothetical protein [Puia sp.]